MEKYYSPSGKVPALAFVIFFALLIIVIPLLATIYAYAIWYIPVPYINFILTGIFGFAIGWLINNIVVKYGKVRSSKWAMIFAIIAALVAIYVHWAVWIDLVMNISGVVGGDELGVATSNAKIGEVLALILSPGGLWEIMGEINKVGVWGIKGGTVSGTFLTVIWVLEFLIILLGSLFTGGNQVGKPFCEEENTWFNETHLSPSMAISDPQPLLTAITEGNNKALSELILPSTDSAFDHHSVVTLYDAKTGENYMTVTNKIAKQDKEGKISFQDQSLIEYLNVNQSVVDAIKQKLV